MSKDKCVCFIAQMVYVKNYALKKKKTSVVQRYVCAYLSNLNIYFLE